MSHATHKHNHDYVIQDSKIGANEKKTMFVLRKNNDKWKIINIHWS